MTTWPNWVDVCVLTIVLRAGYVGLVRGAFAELLGAIGAIGITALSVGYWGVLIGRVEPWLRLPPAVASSLVFWVLFILLFLLVRGLVSALLNAIKKWDQLNWFTQSVGLAFGLVRGAWWAGFLVLVLTTNGWSYLKTSVQERSVSSPPLMDAFHRSLAAVVEQLPRSGDHRVLIPSLVEAD